MGALGFGALLLAAAASVFYLGPDDVAGWDRADAAAFLAASAAALLMASWIFNEFRANWREGLKSVAFWGVIFTAGGIVYANRDQLYVVLDRVIGEVSPGRSITTDSGEVVVPRRTDGSFTISGRLNHRDTRFMFDTGASMVVLTAESAAAAGLEVGRLSYSIPVSTANGMALAAPVTLDSLTVGSITERRVRALVARPGQLQQNLLGMTFLERLASYEVRGNRLILRPRGARAPA